MVNLVGSNGLYDQLEALSVTTETNQVEREIPERSLEIRAVKGAEEIESANEDMDCPFKILPDELIIAIFSNLDDKDLKIKTQLTCKRWLDLSFAVLIRRRPPFNIAFKNAIFGVNKGDLTRQDLFMIKEIKLRHCHFKGNEKKIPGWIMLFPNLRKLDATCCKLEKISKKIISCTKLETLNLGGNNFNEFPIIVLQIPSLKLINLSNNSEELTIPNELPDTIKVIDSNSNLIISMIL